MHMKTLVRMPSVTILGQLLDCTLLRWVLLRVLTHTDMRVNRAFDQTNPLIGGRLFPSSPTVSSWLIGSQLRVVYIIVSHSRVYK